MKAVTRNRVINNLYLSTFLIAFGSVALASVLPCPAHTVSSDTSEEMTDKNKKQQENKK
ncbi:similar to Saccharomyces cerevisiae YPL189C-A COA2 Cytochrome oxidase assembly factor [Maudiozyma barnettii]|uniref:Similar to Saccharomyces cerevisiae YPL189C-A COA2 Cytochrome oxidase assembly factor n=1 Tax=Maudiozyma barnettii TaxID=61262 RepID=A0A8H2VJA2_9SACH|nr:Coa2p [Kazachstania barnettii]CAB4256699.1 similar to Saccharomyces cerevisiae YPL189C-A COA2 Cytochrome oxidase assembly factor [Kazachstania barnettii]CAD1785355.1 similar to Saccharomyces cerevisiae YPL189C-A COA2 Cytochrome oxidase assembly factor [Kazachstania barnettii]